MFREDFFKQFHHATNYWTRYEWKHHGYPHVHGFIWLKYAPNMDTLNWDDPTKVRSVKKYFDGCMHGMNPRNRHKINIQVRRNVDDHPSVNNTEQNFQSNLMIRYEEFLNCLEHHITCSDKTCL